MSFKKIYEHFFYRCYKIAMMSEFNWLPVFRATILMLIIEVFILMTLIGYVNLVTTYNIIPDSFYNIYFFIMGGIMLWSKYYYFDKDDKWKDIVAINEKLSQKQQRVRTAVFIFSVLFIIGALVLMFYLTGKKSGVIA